MHEIKPYQKSSRNNCHSAVVSDSEPQGLIERKQKELQSILMGVLKLQQQTKDK